MNLIIVGASPEGVSLAELALKDGHNVAIIEASEERALEVLQEYDIKVFHANITQGGILDEAGADQADAIIATTSDDSANLMTMFLGKEYNIPTLISMVHEKEHRGLFTKIGVHVIVDPEVIIAHHLYNLLPEA
ncbi:potassium channel family protein [Halotia branconii]|uniref:NAD-binding protein n=1 Tax=Halotia branconii CENA392 TaxID=1539056 RepID=A0AAJ6P8J4_9CYAN|nr:NAD-binding protein [Halotia branconii]WGV24702.1 NAD-binding protein [Halotia branconii CENA392]